MIESRKTPSNFGKKLLDILVEIPALRDPDNRERLLDGLPVGPTGAIQRNSAWWTDLGNIIAAAEGWGVLATGAQPLAVIARNTLPLTQGTRVHSQLIALLATLGSTVDLVSPYRGLTAFREQDAPYFFGRETFSQRLYEAVQSHSLVTLIGPSGSGKSSIIFAGLVPALRNEGKWMLANFRPGSEPFRALAAALLPLYETDLSQTDRLIESRKLATALGQGKLLLADIISQIQEQQPIDGQLLLMADQFEELYTLCSDPETRHLFLDMLLAGLSDQKSLTVLLSLRADFLSQALDYRPFADRLQDADVKLGPMTRDELQAAIEQPAQAQNVAFEPGLVQRILDDVDQEPGYLPLLEFALTELWDQQVNGYLTHTAYETVGQVTGALTHYADQVYGGLNLEEQSQARHIFTQLVQPGIGTEDTRRLATQVELGQRHWSLVQRLATARLVVTNQTETETVEVVHEALIQHWELLRDWMAADHDFRIWQEKLRVALGQWEASKRDEEVLLRGRPLAEAEEWLGKRKTDLNPDEQAFIQAGITLREQQRITRERRRNTIIIVAVFVALLMTGLAYFGLNRSQAATNSEATAVAERITAQVASTAAIEQKTTAEAAGTVISLERDNTNKQKALAEQQTRLARAAQLAAQSQATSLEHPSRSLLLAVEAFTVLQNDDPYLPNPHQALHESLQKPLGHALTGHENIVWAVAFSPDGQWLATASADHTARLWSIAGPQIEPRILAGHEGEVWAVAFSPDGQWLATASADHTARLWSIAGPQIEPRILAGHREQIKTIAFSPDGQWLATAGDDSTTRLWSIADPQAEPRVLAGHEGKVWAVAFSPDGQWLATADNTTARLWSITAPQAEPRVLAGHNGVVIAVAFSPDGQWLATASADATVRLWSMADPRAESRVLTGHREWIEAVAFSPDGRWLATASADHTAFLRSMVDPQVKFHVLTDHESLVRTVAFSPDGQWLATAGDDATIRLWEVADPQSEPRVLYGHEEVVGAVAFSPDGQWLATAGGDHTARLWLVPQAEPRILHRRVDWIKAVAFSPDGQWLAIPGDGTTVHLLEMASPQTKPHILPGHNFGVEIAAFSPDGQWLATSADTTVRLWKVADPQSVPHVLADHEGRVRTVAFSPDGQWLATSTDTTVRLWKVSNPQFEPRVLHGHEDRVSGVAFSPDGQWLATTDDVNTRLWEVSNPQSEPRVLRGHEDGVSGVAFSPDGQWLATASADHTARLWSIAGPQIEPRILAGHEGAVWAVAFSPDGQWLATSSADHTARLWEVSNPQSEPRVLRGHEDGVSGVAFSPDGQWLATSSVDHTARLWLMTNLQAGPRVLRGHEDGVSDVAFSPDGQWLVTVAYGDAARLWLVKTTDLITLACHFANRNFTSSEWEQYFPNHIYHPTCSNWPIHPSVTTKSVLTVTASAPAQISTPTPPPTPMPTGFSDF